MALVTLKQIHAGRDGSIGLDNVAYSRVYRAETDTAFDEADDVALATAAALGVDIGSPFNLGSPALLRQVDPKQESFSPRIWIVTLNYSTSPVERDPDDPTADGVEFDWGGELFQRPYFFDRAGNAVLNSAGDWIVEGNEGDDSHVNVTLRFNAITVPTWILTYNNKLNAAAVVIDGVTVGAELAKIDIVRVSPVHYRRSVSYRTVTVPIRIRPQGWSLGGGLLDRGFHEVDPADDTKRRKIVLDDGTTPSEPQLLDGSGKRLADPKPGNAVIATYHYLSTVDFTVFPGISAA